jgi:hypothetical protein
MEKDTGNKNMETNFGALLENGAYINVTVSFFLGEGRSEEREKERRESVNEIYYFHYFISFFFDTLKVLQFEETSTSYPFANTTTTYLANTLKLNVLIQNWPFLALSNSLAGI